MTITKTVYDQEYFSGTQTNIYIGDVLIDEITGLQVQVEQKKLPVYGYASQLFDKVAKGTVLVQGAFTINFKEAGYLNAVLNRFVSRNEGFSAANTSPFISSTSFSGKFKTRGGAMSESDIGVLRRQNIEQIQNTVDQVVEGKSIDGRALSPEALTEYYRSLTGFNNNSPARAGSVAGALPSIEKTFETFEDKIWGTDNLDRDEEGRRGDSNRFDNFTIYVTMGDYNRNNRVNHTSKRIDNVHLLGQAQTISINGEPIQERYDFFARNFV